MNTSRELCFFREGNDGLLPRRKSLPLPGRLFGSRSGRCGSGTSSAEQIERQTSTEAWYRSDERHNPERTPHRCQTNNSTEVCQTDGDRQPMIGKETCDATGPKETAAAAGIES